MFEQIITVWGLLSELELWLPQASTVLYCNGRTGLVRSKAITTTQQQKRETIHTTQLKKFIYIFFFCES